MNLSFKPLTNKPLVKGKTLLLFDVDGTLTKPIEKIGKEMVDALESAKKVENIFIGTVGGNDYKKEKFQLEDANKFIDYHFCENGLQVYDKEEKLIHQYSLKEELGEENIKKFINFCLRYMADLDIPKKRGTFIEYRTGMINLSPIGRNCTMEERNEFYEYNLKNKVLVNFREALDDKFGKDLKMKFSIGGQISLDCFPKGWDKTYCLQYTKDFDNIVFFGDRTSLGGNDFEISRSDKITRAYSVQNPEDTIKKLNEVLEEIKQIK